MIKKCLLETNGYRIFFNLKSAEGTKADFVDSIVEFQLNPLLGELLVRSIPAFITFQDLQRLATYFEQHITVLKGNPDSESHTFVTYALSFQVQALSGRVLSESEGFFSIQFMVNVGQADEGGSRTYIGGESVVAFENIRSFTSSLRAAVAELSHCS